MKTNEIYIATIARITEIQPAFKTEMGYVNFEELEGKFLAKRGEDDIYTLLFSKLRLSDKYTAKDIGGYFINTVEPIRLYTRKPSSSRKELLSIEKLINEDPKVFTTIFKKEEKGKNTEPKKQTKATTKKKK